jgi:hypothetical protein
MQAESASGKVMNDKAYLSGVDNITFDGIRGLALAREKQVEDHYAAQLGIDPQELYSSTLREELERRAMSAQD